MLRNSPGSTFADALAGLKASAEETRLRLIALLAEGELTVSEIVEILGQSQPRISRHLKLLAEAGLVERHREGAWAFFRLEGAAEGMARRLVALLDPADPILARDRERLDHIRAERSRAAERYFDRHARNWNEIRALHVSEKAVEDAIIEAVGDFPYRALLDLGTGTGRILELLGPAAERGLGIDQSTEMLAIARANLERAGLRNCTVRQGDIYSLPLPRGSQDLVIVHQVLHFLDDPARALKEAARVLRPGGRLLVVDFAPHELEFLRDAHAHRRLGFAEETVGDWLAAAGLDLVATKALAPGGAADTKGLTVNLWLARDPRLLLADTAALA